MLDILTVLQGNIAANYLFQLMFPSWLDGNSGLYKVVLYQSAMLGDPQVSVTIGGRCFAGRVEVSCGELDLGDDTLRLIPWLRATHEIFFGLVLLSSVADILFYYNAKKGWPTNRELRGYRTSIICLQCLCVVSGLSASIMSLAMMVTPYLRYESNSLVDVTLGWGQVFTLVMAICAGFLTVGFASESRTIIDEYEGVLVLEEDDEDEDDATLQTGFLSSVEKRDCSPGLEGYLVEV